MTEQTKTIIANVATIAVIALIMLWGATQYRQWYQFQVGDSALASGDYIHAIAGYESALHMYTPASPLVPRAAVKLWGIGETLERQGEVDRALLAYRALRSSFYAVHGLTKPGLDWIDRCDARIRLLAKPAPPAP
jgi:hypothetical protein